MKYVYIILLFCIISNKEVISQEYKVTSFEERYQVPIFYKYDSNFFSIELDKYNPNGVQVEQHHLDILINSITRFFINYPKEVVSNNINAIYLLEKFEIANQKPDILHWGNTLYISYNFNEDINSEIEFTQKLHKEFTLMILSNYDNISHILNGIKIILRISFTMIL